MLPQILTNRVPGESSEMAFHKTQCYPLPLLLNVCTKDQPLPVATISFIYADDLRLATPEDVRTGGVYNRQRTKQAGCLLQG